MRWAIFVRIAAVVLCFALCMAWYIPQSDAQVLGQQPWAQQAEREIAAHRMREIRVIVHDELGNPQSGVPVRITMSQHAFAFGAVMPELREADMPMHEAHIHWLTQHRELPLMRRLSHVAIDSATEWKRITTSDGLTDTAAVDHLLNHLADHALRPRWGVVCPAAASRANPAGEDNGEPADAFEAMKARITHVAQRYGTRVGDLDIMAFTEGDRVDPAAMRLLFEHARAISPQSRLGVRFTAALTGPSLIEMLREVGGLREALVPLDYIAVDVRVHGPVLQKPLRDALDWIAGYDLPLVIASLEVGGADEAAAAIHMETLLRTLFSHRVVDAIYFAGWDRSRTRIPHAAMVSELGFPTDSARIAEKLLYEQWQTDATSITDQRGELRLRVFAGIYDLRAELQDGDEAHLRAWVPLGEGERLILLQPRLFRVP